MRERKWVVGTAALGLPYGLGAAGESLLSDVECTDLVEGSVVRGLMTFDTAPAYGIAEERLGRVLGARGNVWTKATSIAGDGKSLGEKLSRSIDGSLARLARPKLELLQWHNWTRNLADDREFVHAWSALQGDPRVGALGASTYGPDDARAAVECGLFRSVQLEWNLLNQGSLAAAGPAATAANVLIAVRSVLLQGVLSDALVRMPAEPELERGRAKAAAAAQRIGIPLQELALRAAAAHPHVTRVLVGVERVSDLDGLLDIDRRPPLDIAQLQALEELDLGGHRAADPRFWGR